ncbi:response regulator transcription factor [Pseudonocardia sp. S2-4]|uniref:Response regulator transcription factor n=1 Tax=Pseudonocardia humida TaxID=2800819 RepID=A0ABT1AAF1_9PSEU|nr:response regulator transcription factor [Pseudonocardia humida]
MNEGSTDPAAGPVRVLLVDDDPLVRSGLTMMLTGAGDIEVVGGVGDGAEVADAVARLRPRVVLMDIRMPVLDGIAATRALAARGDPARRPAVVVLTTFGADDNVLAAVRAGAAGFLLKHTPPAEIVAAVRRAAAGEPVLSPAAARALMELTRRGGGARPAAAERLARLTDREREVAVALAEGLTNAEIAARLHLSVSSVKATVSAALTRLDLTNRVQLAILAHEAGPATGDGRGRTGA